MPTTPLPIDLVEPDAAAPVGDRWPCHLFEPAVSWPVPPDAVLRQDRPRRACPPCTGRCYQGRRCPVAAAAMQAHIDEGLAASLVRHQRLARRIVLGFVAGAVLMALLLVALP